MGTRNSTFVILKGETRIAQYGQWDGYLGGSGNNILNFFSQEDFSLDKFKESVENVSTFSEEEIQKIDKDPNWEKSYPQISRNMGSSILNFVYNEYKIGNSCKVTLDEEFPYDSLFCEYCYVIDLDNDFLEIYKGFNKTKLSESDRFFKEKADRGGYYGCKLMGMLSLSDLPLSFMEKEEGIYVIYKDKSVREFKSIEREIKINRIA